MSDVYGGSPGPGARAPSERVGTAEREAAIAALDVHWGAGRLDPGEHEARTTRARSARTRADLAALFTDLPAPGPDGRMQPGPPPVPAGQPPVGQPSAGQPPAGQYPVPAGTERAPSPVRPDSVVGRYRETIMALAPLAAVVLFFVTGSWLWFLMIPIAGILLYGPGERKGHRRDRRDRRRC